jgi:hypothetical protein
MVAMLENLCAVLRLVYICALVWNIENAAIKDVWKAE